MEQEMFIHELKLEETDTFSKNFNKVSELFRIATTTDDEKDWEEYYMAKFRLEQGLPV